MATENDYPSNPLAIFGTAIELGLGVAIANEFNYLRSQGIDSAIAITSIKNNPVFIAVAQVFWPDRGWIRCAC